jgi:hypothetical protein
MNDTTDFRDGWKAGYKTGSKHGMSKHPYLREPKGNDVSHEQFAGYRAGYLSAYYIDSVAAKWSSGFQRAKRSRHD